MSKDSLLIDALDRRVARREGRRNFIMKGATLMAGAAAGGVLTACGNGGSSAIGQTGGETSSQTQQDLDVLNFALNLEYLEANFYSWAVLGHGIDASLQTGTGTQGAVTGGAQVDFSADPFVQSYAKEIASDEINHVAFLRSALGSMAVAQPAINIDGTSATGAFSLAAQAAGVVAAGQTFNPYSSPNNFLLGAFIFEDVGVTAYHGAATLISNKDYLDAAAGILAVEAYHAGIVRLLCYQNGLGHLANKISDLRNKLSQAAGSERWSDQGVIIGGVPNLVPTHPRTSVAFERNTTEVLNIVYAGGSSGGFGFFPDRLNGKIN
jgi:hypothetical protein